MSAQIIVLADRRSDRSDAQPLDASAASGDAELGTLADCVAMADPYGLVAAVRALAANMERMRGRSAEMQMADPSPSDRARAVVSEGDTIAEAVEKLGDVGAFFVCV
ncbi:MAG: hypothetical protein JO255_20480 [Alphaproteobacteria bacterium]|nr:hypothetical protein [Alphaproteobacteria bacterium]